MDVSTGNASRARLGMRMFPLKTPKYITAAIVLLCSVVGAILVVWLPYDRVVVFTQPIGTVVRISSVRLHKAGFVAVYYDGPMGSRVIGHSAYLPPGYYRNMTIPIAYTLVLPPIATLPMSYILKNTPMFVRLYWDNGDKMFDEFTDTGVKNVFGKVYTKHFWLVYETNPIVDALRSFAYYPEYFFTDRILP